MSYRQSLAHLALFSLEKRKKRHFSLWERWLHPYAKQSTMVVSGAAEAPKAVVTGCRRPEVRSNETSEAYITTVKVHKIPRNTYWNMVCLVSTVCIFSMTLFTYTYLSNMACPKRVLSWANTVCVHWTEPGSRDVINWQWRYVIRAQIICYRNNLHDVLECLLVKNCPTPPGLPIPVANKIQKQYNTKTGPQTDDVWRILWRQREREAVATDFLPRPYATPEWRWFWHANKIYGITPFMLNGLYRNMPVFLEDSFLDSGTQSKFWIRPVSIKRTNLQKCSTGKTADQCPTVMSVERSVTKGQSPGYHEQWCGDCGFGITSQLLPLTLNERTSHRQSNDAIWDLRHDLRRDSIESRWFSFVCEYDLTWTRCGGLRLPPCSDFPLNYCAGAPSKTLK